MSIYPTAARRFVYLNLTLLLTAVVAPPAATAALVLVSIPVNSMDSASRPLNEGVWSDDPSDGYSGIGHLVNPGLPVSGDFVLHDHQYVAPNVPDPTRAIVTYGFNVPTQVNSIEIIEHANGISAIEGFVGNSLGSMTSIGIYSGNAGLGPYTELSSNLFTFVNPNSALYFQFVVTLTTDAGGYAAYRAYPDVTVGAVPEATTFMLWGTILLSAGLVPKVRQKFFG